MASPEITEDIPNDVWFEICKFIPVKDLKQVRQVCRGLKKYSEENAERIQVAAGSRHSLAIIDGNLYSWGNNSLGQLGFIYKGNKTIPTIIPTVSKIMFTQISCGNLFNLALDVDGDIYSWGDNLSGQLGLGGSVPRGVNNIGIPTKIPSSVKFKYITAGPDFSLAIDVNGNLYGWGNNYDNQLGIEGKSIRIPTPIPTPSQFVMVSCGFNFCLGVDIFGRLYGWGNNNDNQLGLGMGKIPSPTLIPTTNPISTISCGINHSLIVDNQGNLYSVGVNSNGFLGLGNKAAVRLKSFTIVPTSNPIVKVSAGHHYSLIIDNAGQLYGFGLNNYGQLGVGDEKNRTTPTLVTSSVSFVNVSAGSGFSLGVTNNLRVYGWGENGFGQLGIGNTRSQTKPKPVYKL